MRTLALLLAALPGGLAAQSTSFQATFEGSAFESETAFRLHTDALAGFGRSGLQVAATFGTLTDDDTLTDLRLIAFQRIGSRWHYGAELQYSDDAVLGGADYALGFRLRYSDAGGTVDSRIALAQNGTDGAFSVTVAMNQNLTDRTRVTGALQRFSTNTETGDYFAIGLGGEADMTAHLTGYGTAAWALADDFSAETVTATLGLARDLRPGLRGHAGLTARQTTDEDTQFGLSAGLTLTLDETRPLFETDPFGQQLAHLGH